MRYKLIQEYPGSLPKNTIITRDGDYYKTILCGHTYVVDPSFIEHYPQFWLHESLWNQSEDHKVILNIIKEQIVLGSDYTPLRYAPEYAARLIVEYFQNK